MAHTYLLFDFGTDEEKAQLARHKLEGWKQAFRLDKKLQYKLERAEDEAAAAAEPAEKDEKSAEPAKAEKPKAKAKTKGKHKSKAHEAEAHEEEPTPPNGKVNLLVRLYFSGHEKLTEQRWLDRIPSEEPFKEASPRVVRQGEEQFDEVVKQFDSLG
jgi:hypothetical protein